MYHLCLVHVDLACYPVNCCGAVSVSSCRAAVMTPGSLCVNAAAVLSLIPSIEAASEGVSVSSCRTQAL